MALRQGQAVYGDGIEGPCEPNGAKIEARPHHGKRQHLSHSRARISRYELGIHEQPVPTARLIANAMGVPLAYMYCEDDKVAALLLGLHKMKPAARDRKVAELLG